MKAIEINYSIPLKYRLLTFYSPSKSRNSINILSVIEKSKFNVHTIHLFILKYLYFSINDNFHFFIYYVYFFIYLNSVQFITSNCLHFYVKIFFGKILLLAELYCISFTSYYIIIIAKI